MNIKPSKNETILYHITTPGKEQRFLQLCKNLRIHTRKLKESDVNATVATLAGIPVKGMTGAKEQAPAGYRLSEMLIFSGLSDGRLDVFLAVYKEQQIEPITLKAIVTPHNLTWSIYQLERELQRERIAMMLGRK